MHLYSKFGVSISICYWGTSIVPLIASLAFEFYEPVLHITNSLAFLGWKWHSDSPFSNFFLIFAPSVYLYEYITILRGQAEELWKSGNLSGFYAYFKHVYSYFSLFDVILGHYQGFHRILLRSECIVLLGSFKKPNVLLCSFFEFLATYKTQKNKESFSFFS